MYIGFSQKDKKLIEREREKKSIKFPYSVLAKQRYFS